MVNVERVKKAIAVMERVRNRGDKLNMQIWQDSASAIKTKERELHQCGTAACFAGWLAVSPEFQNDGGKVLSNGSPSYRGDRNEFAVRHYLEISIEQAEELTAISGPLAYKVNDFSDITAEMVLDKLHELIQE